MPKSINLPTDGKTQSLKTQNAFFFVASLLNGYVTT
jgi:hypothetical protein